MINRDKQDHPTLSEIPPLIEAAEAQQLTHSQQEMTNPPTLSQIKHLNLIILLKKEQNSLRVSLPKKKCQAILSKRSKEVTSYQISSRAKVSNLPTPLKVQILLNQKLNNRQIPLRQRRIKARARKESIPFQIFLNLLPLTSYKTLVSKDLSKKWIL